MTTHKHVSVTIRRTSDLTDADYDRAIGVMVRHKHVSTSLVQRELGLGYNAAAKLVERAEADGIVTRPNEVGKRSLAAIQPDPETKPVEWDAHAEFKAAEDHARKALRHVCGDLSGQKMTVGKHESRNHEHLRRIYTEARASNPRFADTLAWLLWHDILDAQRLALLTEAATPSSAGMVSVEAAARIVTAYDRDYPMRTADQHRDGCFCLRCSVDALRALAGEGK